MCWRVPGSNDSPEYGWCRRHTTIVHCRFMPSSASWCASRWRRCKASELSAAIEQKSASVVEHDGRISGYATMIGFFGHAVSETNEDMKALIGAATSIVGPGLLLPTRNAELFRWCLNHGLRVVQPMTLMSLDLYNEPSGAFLPSVIY